MKKFYLVLLLVIASFYQNKLAAQAILIDDNHNLSGLPFNGKLLLVSDRDSTLWSSDGTAAGTAQFSSVKVDQNGSALFNGKFYFSGMNAANGSELWLTDGTGGGTNLVSDIWAGPDSSKPRNYIVYNNKLYFTAYTPSLGRELYQYSGSGAPANITDLNPGSGSSFNNINEYSNQFFVNNNTMFFNATNGTGNALYAMQGASIIKILDIPTGYQLANHAYLGNTTIFMISGSPSGASIYKTDGSLGGTTLIKSFSGYNSGFSGMVTWNGKVYFNAAETLMNNELWSTDGTTAQMVADINPGPNGSYPILYNAVILKNKLVFSAQTDASGMELWTTDGTASGTAMLKDINTTAGSGSDPVLWPVINMDINNLQGLFDMSANYGGYLFFTANDGVHGIELWKTDGTAANTVMVKDINPAGDGVGSSYIYTTSGVVFSGNDGTNGMEPWSSDGTSTGTKAIANINPSGDANPEFLFIWNGDIYLNADNGNGGVEQYFDLYKLVGPYTPIPIVLVDITAVANVNSVTLNWKTATESNSDRFVILRSTDGEHFSEIGDVNASGNSNTLRNYSFTDDGAYQTGATTLYYRLNMKDRDNRSVLSKVVAVSLNSTVASLSIFPNPVSQVLQFRYNLKQGGRFVIMQENGGVVYQDVLSPSLNGLKAVNISGLPVGGYIIKVIDGSRSVNQRFIKK